MLHTPRSAFAAAIAIIAAVLVLHSSCKQNRAGVVQLKKNAHVVLIGNNLGSRMMHYGHFETELQLRFPDSSLYVRNMCRPGETAGFRPHPGRKTPWAFPGAETFNAGLARNSESEGFFEYPDEWLTRHKADIILAFFGYNESFNGPQGVDMFKAELDSFIKYTKKQRYNGVSAPQLVLVSPIAFQNLSSKYDLPDGRQQNENLKLYTSAMQDVADANDVPLLNVFGATSKWFEDDEQLTIDGSQLNNEGYRRFAVLLSDLAFGENSRAKDQNNRDAIHTAVMEKNWMWRNDYKIPNGVHVFGRRYNPFGPDNYPAELRKIRAMTSIRDSAVWAAAKGQSFDLATADARTDTLPRVTTNYNPKQNGSLKYLYGKDALSKFQLPNGYKIELFASEQEFKDLAKPVQMSFDNKGRLWIATMPSYPHYKPGDKKPNDKIIILEDTNADGRADVQKVFADGLHLPVGFEIAPEGVYVSQGNDLILMTDTNGDDKADIRELILSGFDDHDTHHAHHAYTTDPGGAIYMGEGVFLHTNVETSYGPVRATNGGFYRFNPQRHQLERTAQLSIPNPWGITFDEWGQNFFAETSSPDVRWMMPGSVKPRYGVATHKSFNLIEQKHMVRPTSGLEIVSSRHFPDEVQGDLLINNTIGFLGTKQHVVEDDGTGFKTRHRHDLLKSDDRNFRPVDLEFAPDGSLYLIDWHNILIGHMQHNARDPLRDHVHGRVYRITYPARPLVTPAKIDGATIDQLVEYLKVPEYRTRYRARRELRGREAGEVLAHLESWIGKLDKSDPQYEHHLTEALWVSWGANRVNQDLLKTLLKAKDFRARAAAVRVLRYTGHQVQDQAALLKQAASDENGRVRLEAIVAASWLDKENGLAILQEAAKKPLDEWMVHAHETAVAHLNDREVEEKKEMIGNNELSGVNQAQYNKGKEIYNKEGYCATCHLADGTGLSQSGFPPLKNTAYVNGSEERLIKIVLKGLQGPIEVNGIKYPGQVPMTPFEGMLNDDEVAAVLTYVRNSFGNKASAVDASTVKRVREKIKDRKGFYNPADLLKEHPLEKMQTANR